MKARALLFSDGSEMSLAAAVYAAGLMKDRPGMELTVVSLLAGVPRGPFGLTRDEETAGARALAAISRQIVQTTKKVFDERRIKVETMAGVLETGSLPVKIARLARDGNYNLIIMGTRGPAGLRGLPARSTAHAVARAAPCSVLLVKEPLGEILETPGEQARRPCSTSSASAPV